MKTKKKVVQKNKKKTTNKEPINNIHNESTLDLNKIKSGSKFCKFCRY